ncbi:MAG: mitochondrial fission ELM1 family protein [Candidatus Omnitrophica bacterium]|nr:mitochondrial fission ELM1 family protein [Candidatus Omnitrophota bacterium]
MSDGKAGHLNQGMAVAEMVEEALGSRLKARGIKERPIVKIRVVEIRFKNAFARMLLDASSLFASSWCQGCLRCLRFLLKKESFDKIKNQYADIVISCGASTVGAGIFLKYENNAKSAVIMKPGLGRSRKTNLVILPRHDAPKKVRLNMIITEAAPNRIQPGHKKGSGIGLLIGGDAKNFKLKREEVEKVINGVLKIAEEMNQDIFVTTSRRTSSEIDSLLKNRLANHRCCKLLVIAKEANPEGTVRKILDSSEVVIVSPESISMISEAASSGRYVVVFKRSSMSKGKYEKSIANLQSHGYIKSAAPDEIYNTLRCFLTEKPHIKKIEDREKIIKRLEVVI